MANSIVPMRQVKHLETSITCPITTLDNNIYIYETNYPAALPSGSKIINVNVRSATIFISWNDNTQKMYIWCAKEKPTSNTYTIDVFYC